MVSCMVPGHRVRVCVVSSNGTEIGFPRWVSTTLSSSDKNRWTRLQTCFHYRRRTNSDQLCDTPVNCENKKVAQLRHLALLTCYRQVAYLLTEAQDLPITSK